MKALVPLAEGFEEIEAVSIIDVLRRADISVITAALAGTTVTGSHAIPVAADRELDGVHADDFGLIVLPGGMPGSEHLKNDARVISLVRRIHASDGIAGAICAAPIVLAAAGVLAGKQATCFPGFETELAGAIYNPKPVILDGRIVTGRGAGCAIPFALEIVGLVRGKDVMRGLAKQLQVYWL
ncbi:MAG TPA: DJ-1/PfpI family protein [Spirochaetota bacterium]|nr:DJ-1/PfpI family protein [Spirochaetota bacterium]